MAKDPAKDFGPIAEDYEFFASHATEAEEDARAYGARLAQLAAAPVRMLDFGCGDGDFTERVLRQAGWPSGGVELTLVEPVEEVRRQAVARLGKMSGTPIVDGAALTADSAGRFDVVLANHVFYYVPQLTKQLGRLREALAPGGVFLTAIAARTNALIEVWIVAFEMLGMDVPYHTSEDVEAALCELRADYEKLPVPYRLTFPDTEANRMCILRFLLADHLGELQLRPLLELFDKYREAGEIRIATQSDHFVVRG